MYFDAVEFVKRLAVLRKTMGYTQEEFAECMNISYEHLSKIERGKRNCSIDLYMAMAGFLNVDLNYFLSGKTYERLADRNDVLRIIEQLTDLAKRL